MFPARKQWDGLPLSLAQRGKFWLWLGECGASTLTYGVRAMYLVEETEFLGTLGSTMDRGSIGEFLAIELFHD